MSNIRVHFVDVLGEQLAQWDALQVPREGEQVVVAEGYHRMVLAVVWYSAFRVKAVVGRPLAPPEGIANE